MKKFILSSILALAFVAHSEAATIQIDSAGSGLRDSSGTALGNATILIGTLNTVVTDWSLYANDPTAFDAIFDTTQAFTNATLVDGGTPGLFSLSNSSYTATAADAGDNVYVWVLNNSNPGSATQQAIFGYNGNKKFADPGDVLPDNLFLSLDSDATGLVAHVGGLNTGVDLGGFGSPYFSHNLANIAAIPEPSRFVLGFFGLGALFLRRRRA